MEFHYIGTNRELASMPILKKTRFLLYVEHDFTIASRCFVDREYNIRWDYKLIVYVNLSFLWGLVGQTGSCWAAALLRSSESSLSGRSESIEATILRAGPSFMDMAITRCSGRMRIRASPSTSCRMNSSAYMAQPGMLRMNSDTWFTFHLRAAWGGSLWLWDSSVFVDEAVFIESFVSEPPAVEI